MSYSKPSTSSTASTAVIRDANVNISVNNTLEGYSTTATAAGTTTLLVGSTQQQFFTGSTTQTVLLPVASTLVLGHTFRVVNNSSGVVTVQSSGANTVQAMAASTAAIFTCILTSGTSAASWSVYYVTAGSASTSLSLSLDGGGAVITTGSHGWITIPTTFTATKWYLVADVSGSVIIDVKRSGASIVGGAGNKPTLSLAVSGNATISGWTSAVFTQGDIINFNIDSASTITFINLVII